MESRHQNSSNESYTDFKSPVQSSQKTFLGKKLKISSEAQNTINRLSRHDQLKLHNQLNKLVTDVVNHRLHQGKAIYLELSGSFLKISFNKASAPYVASISKARIIKKPKPLRAAPNEEKALNDCKIRTTRGMVREIVYLNYQFEKVLTPNIFSARELVNIQTLRMREHVRDWAMTQRLDRDRVGHTNTQWADVCYGAKPGIFNNGSGDEIVALSAIFAISKQTRIMSKTYFGAVRQTDVKKILHRYAVIFGHPHYDEREPYNNIQEQLKESEPSRKSSMRQYLHQPQKYGSDVVIHVDSDLNIHKFFRNGQYQFIDCSGELYK